MKPTTTHFDKLSRSIYFLLIVFLSTFCFQPKHSLFSKTLSKLLLPSHFSFPPAFLKRINFDFSDLVIVILFLLLTFRFRLSDLFWKGTSKPLTLFLSVSCLSIVFSDTGSYLFPYLFFFKFSLSCLLFHILRVLCETDPIYWYRLVAQIIVIIATGTSFIGIAQYFYQSTIGLSWIGETNFRFLGFFNPTQNRWALDALFSIKTGSETLFRSSSVFYHANPFGGFLFCSLLFTDFFFLKKKRFPLLLSVLVFLQVFALFTTFSRSGMLAVFLGTSFLLCLQRKNCLVQQRVKQLSLIFFSSFLFCFCLFYPQLFVRGGVVNYPPITQEADQERLTYQKVAFQMGKEHPILGVGFNHFQFSLPSYLPKGQEHSLLYKVHNIFLLILAETGGLGLVVFLYFLFFVVQKGFFSRSIPKGIRPLTTLKRWKSSIQGSSLESQILLCIFMGFILIGGCDMYLFENQKLRYLLFIVLGLFNTCQKQPIQMEEG